MASYSKMEMEHVRQMKKHGVPKKYIKEEEKEAKGMRKGGMACGGMKKYAQGGPIANPKAVPKPPKSEAERAKEIEQQMRDEAMDRKMREAAKRFERSKENDSPGMKSGGKVKKYARGGGVESKGKTRGRMC